MCAPGFFQRTSKRPLGSRTNSGSNICFRTTLISHHWYQLALMCENIGVIGPRSCNRKIFAFAEQQIVNEAIAYCPHSARIRQLYDTYHPSEGVLRPNSLGEKNQLNSETRL